MNLNYQQTMKVSPFIVAAAIVSTSFFYAHSADARCGYGFKQLGTSNRCVPADQNNHEMMKRYCTDQTKHYGQIDLNTGTVKSLQEYYANCMGSTF